jgi:hypothetical protein
LGPLVCLGLFAYGLFRFVVGARQCWGLRDTMLASRGFMKFLIGVVGAWFFWGNQHADIVAGNGPWAWLAWLCLFCVALWWAATGAVRFVLMLGLRPQRKPPAPVKNPHGVGGDATAAQARAAMRGQGRQRSRLDDQQF